MRKQPVKKSTRRDFDKKLDRLEVNINELRVLFEQHFVDILPQPPTKLKKEVEKTIRILLKAPFKNSANRFRLRQVIQRYQAYNTYWERVNKQREEGTYCKDTFKANMRERFAAENNYEVSKQGAAEKQIRQLFSTYENALHKTGANTTNVNYDAFKKTLVNKAKQLKKEHGTTKLHYKIMTKNGKVIIKASTGNKASKK